MSRSRGNTVVALEGELDFESAGPVAAALIAVADEGCDVTVDMAGVEFIDCSGLSALLRAHRSFESLGRSLTVRAPSRPVRRMLDVFQLENLISPAARQPR